MIEHTVSILWSGGWDGTFRLLQLATEPICIQPIYVIDENRQSLEFEKGSMQKILDIVSSNGEGQYSFRAKILDIKYYKKMDILHDYQNDEISDAFRYLREKYAIGIQSEWFALLAKHLGLRLEIGTVHQYHGKVENAIEMEGILTLIPNDILPGRYQVLPKGDNYNASLVFGDLIFPIIKLTKKDEERIARENGWLDIMKLTWFCHTPIDGEPCGLCGPCDDAMNTGMEWRMPPKAQRRYKHKDFYLFIRKVRRHLPFKKG